MKTLTRITAILMFAGLLINDARGIANDRLTLKAELQQSVLPANQHQNAVIKISILAPERPEPTTSRKVKANVSIVIDKSGSMSHSGKIDNAKRAAVTALRMLNAEDIFSLIVYDTQARVIIPAQKVEDKRRIESLINAITPSGNTALFSGVSLGANEIRKFSRDGYVNRIILLSDGLANVGPSNPRELGRLGASLIKESVSVSTVGVGDDYNEDLMTELSQNSDGNFYFVENSQDLPMIFSRELGSTLKVAAKSLILHIEFPEGVKPQGILGHNYKINDNRMDVFFNQVYGGHEKSLMLQVLIPPEQARKTLELASLRLDYEDAVNGGKHSARDAVKASFSGDPTEVKESVNPAVVKDYLLQNNAVVKQKAIIEADKGNWQAARKMLQKSAVELKKTAEKTGNKELEKEAKRNLDHARQMEDNSKAGVFKNRKKLKGESYQEINSQMYQQ